MDAARGAHCSRPLPPLPPPPPPPPGSPQPSHLCAARRREAGAEPGSSPAAAPTFPGAGPGSRAYGLHLRLAAASPPPLAGWRGAGEGEGGREAGRCAGPGLAGTRDAGAARAEGADRGGPRTQGERERAGKAAGSWGTQQRAREGTQSPPPQFPATQVSAAPTRGSPLTAPPAGLPCGLLERSFAATLAQSSPLFYFTAFEMCGRSEPCFY
jgi:hypothetical protein